MNTRDRPGSDWTVVLWRQPARMVEGSPEGGYTNMFEIICCDCGDLPDLEYREVSPELQRIRGPYPIAAGVAAYQSTTGGIRTGSRFISQATRIREVKAN